ncbi:MAG: ATP synthase F0 subunit B [Holosporales bacterium]|jgi:F0F1-type ATP synthase membrane subunit b/b'|nr:ATP synthase F0 subunit B [Holosporales bacterium]
MNVLQDIHTYLVVSFIGMIVVLWKLAYGKVRDSISSEVEDVRSRIHALELRKKETELQLKQLDINLKEAAAEIEKSVIAAEEEARRITEKSTAKIATIMETKQKEYDVAIAKIRAGLMAELHNKVVSLVMARLSERLEKSSDDRELQNSAIDISMKMLEKLVDERVGKE